ncbi:hypothetical protein IGI04_010673 [Brassica rapa subsp. trilocularis]|uniref:Uncharacterized protein n=2 Tax=Brassica TaxID=3705 RepID=A0ABQ7N0V2_BRACM|nr:hypothetical protein IGI04_010673 [Brassica rapa subsp. trilocularis]
MASFLMFFTIKTLKRALAVVPRKRNGGDPDGNPSSPSIKQKTIKMRMTIRMKQSLRFIVSNNV